MPKPSAIELTTGELIPILYEDRAVLAIDKPAGWMLVPFSWQKTSRNLQAAIVSSISSGAFWARSRNLKFLRYIHRLDAETSGILLFARSQGALETFSGLFETRRMEKAYLAVVEGTPKEKEWHCRFPMAQDPKHIGRMIVDDRNGKDAETFFRVLETQQNRTLIEGKPITGRTHQIRVHLAHSGFPVLGDELYGKLRTQPSTPIRVAFPLGLRAMQLAYQDPFTKKRVQITAPSDAFLRNFGFEPRPLNR